MKRTLFVLALALMVIGANTFAATILNSKHDLASGSTTTGIKSTNVVETCGFCHVPHNAQAGAAMIIPLWGHTTANAASYTPYTSPTWTDATHNGGAALGSVSLACLSCHDGVTGVGSMVAPAALVTNSTTGTTTSSATMSAALPAAATLGLDMRNDHPIGMSYTAASDYATALTPVASLVNVKVFGATRTVECGSCHSVHNSTAYAFFLYDTMNQSALCLRCHVK